MVDRTLYVRLQGGLGNQLFQLAAATNFLRDTRRRVVLDASLYARKWRRETRPLELPVDGLPVEIVELNPFIARLLSRLPGELGVHQALDNPPNLGAGTRYVVGYFQSFEVAKSATEDLREYLIRSLAKSKEIDHDFVAVHCRLGDYLKPGVRHRHGATDPRWSVEQARRLASEIGASDIRVFTDSPSRLEEILGSNGPEKLHVDPSTGPWDVLSSFSRAKGLVISNSSLSWWAAHIAHHVWEVDAPVVMPYPWFSSPTTMDHSLRAPGWRVVQRDVL